MFTLVMMTALSGSPDAVQFGGRGGCSGGGLLSGLFSRGGRGAAHSGGCCGPVAHHSCCDPCHHGHYHLPACGGCGVSIPAVGCGTVAPNPVPLGATPGVTTEPPKKMDGQAPAATGAPAAPTGVTPGVTAPPTTPPGGSF